MATTMSLSNLSTNIDLLSSSSAVAAVAAASLHGHDVTIQTNNSHNSLDQSITPQLFTQLGTITSSTIPRDPNELCTNLNMVDRHLTNSNFSSFIQQHSQYPTSNQLTSNSSNYFTQSNTHLSTTNCVSMLQQQQQQQQQQPHHHQHQHQQHSELKRDHYEMLDMSTDPTNQFGLVRSWIAQQQQQQQQQNRQNNVNHLHHPNPHQNSPECSNSPSDQSNFLINTPNQPHGCLMNSQSQNNNNNNFNHILSISPNSLGNHNTTNNNSNTNNSTNNGTRNGSMVSAYSAVAAVHHLTQMSNQMVGAINASNNNNNNNSVVGCLFDNTTGSMINNHVPFNNRGLSSNQLVNPTR
ncbi:unnamed protein product [Schistosoma mattheei]|uniref:Uncharacterized protein n=1 Tax=Schistosoma mattheei TaxID=31246 RepID=A0A183NP35_9TREM|nr:unnamed protein product [Schistosoma mattheei]